MSLPPIREILIESLEDQGFKILPALEFFTLRIAHTNESVLSLWVLINGDLINNYNIVINPYIHNVRRSRKELKHLRQQYRLTTLTNML
jgi:hypothetical protein